MFYVICAGITFDDLIVLPGEITFGVEEVDLTSRLSRNIRLNYPLCSSPMDSVTEIDMAVGMALNGGIGIIHSNCTVEDQVLMVKKVKMYENGFIMNPAVLAPYNTIEELDVLREEKSIKGVPVSIDGTYVPPINRHVDPSVLMMMCSDRLSGVQVGRVDI